VFSRAARAVRAEVHETTWQCFWLTAIDGADPTEVSRQFSLSVGTVYAARSRVLARLKRVVQELEGTP
jgi:RNA polymerase sigma-70 factor (ECF subfamily)